MNMFWSSLFSSFQVNLKSARLLRPGNTLQKQIGMANLSKNFESELSPFQLVPSKPPSRLEYNQVSLTGFLKLQLYVKQQYLVK